ncbi:NADH-quinone oxidoreductase subunit NuoH [Bacteroides caecigallinarum]|uniref:NADH-quinone oxidoreductase subunit NuoH n=1 Tax=Bacteroides caecigallinarum TaxID=1411144 RepID=UPI00195EC244|nr:NADH-quinone oxidoreductase subunit NuoH [Bacteroides caecigallinarum]MBM6864257.1 NADH-quinone oxidoreductase subunit NuoH [Bacteroides caecigallinarum]
MFDYYNLEPLLMCIHSAMCSLMPEWLALTIEGIVVGVFIMVMYAVLAIILIYMERKVCAAFQCRIGPDRVGGRGGLLQVPADVIKILTKEIISLKNSDKFLYGLAPFLVIMASILTFSCLPWNKGGEILHMNIGIFFVLAASSIGVLGILLAGWSSNSKYTLIGAVRSGAMIISYELSIGISVLTMVILCGTMDIQEIVAYQENGWNLFKGHIPAIMAFVIYLIAGNAEANRAPFDLAEAEQELTAGYHTEYSGMHFGFFYLAEYLNLFITAGIAVTLFLGGWMPLHIAGLDGFNMVMDYIPGVIWFVGKTFLVVFLLMWIRWTFPRLRIDQVLILEWKYLMPLSLLVLMIMTVFKVFGLVF